MKLTVGPIMWKKVQIAQISLNILAPIPRKNSNPSHPLCQSKNLHGIGKELQHFCFFHPPGSKSWHSEAVRPSLAELAIPSTYWAREEDLDIEYSLVFQKMSFQCWPAVCDVGSPLIQPSRTLRWDVVVCVWDVSGELLGQQTCVV